MSKVAEKIQSLEIKSVALREAVNEYNQELESVKKQINNPAPVLRREAKKSRVINFEKAFIEGKYSRKNKKSTA